MFLLPFWSTSKIKSGPLFFLIFINDIEHRVMHSKVLLYADDLKIFQPIRNSEDSVHLQKDLDSLVEWSETGYHLIWPSAKKYLLPELFEDSLTTLSYTQCEVHHSKRWTMSPVPGNINRQGSNVQGTYCADDSKIKKTAGLHNTKFSKL